MAVPSIMAMAMAMAMAALSLVGCSNPAPPSAAYLAGQQDARNGVAATFVGTRVAGAPAEPCETAAVALSYHSGSVDYGDFVSGCKQVLGNKG